MQQVNAKSFKLKFQSKRKAVLAEMALGEHGDEDQPVTMIKGKLLTKDQVNERGLLEGDMRDKLVTKRKVIQKKKMSAVSGASGPANGH